MLAPMRALPSDLIDPDHLTCAMAHRQARRRRLGEFRSLVVRVLCDRAESSVGRAQQGLPLRRGVPFCAREISSRYGTILA